MLRDCWRLGAVGKTWVQAFVPLKAGAVLSVVSASVCVCVRGLFWELPAAKREGPGALRGTIWATVNIVLIRAVLRVEIGFYKGYYGS